MPIEMYWEHRKLLRAEALALLRPSPAMEHENRAISTAHLYSVLLRQQNPLLSIQLAASEELKELYCQSTQDIVQCNLASYVLIAYVDEDSMLPEQLLRAVRSFYEALFRAGREVFANIIP
jgi:hypothetical protein